MKNITLFKISDFFSIGMVLGCMVIMLFIGFSDLFLFNVGVGFRYLFLVILAFLFTFGIYSIFRYRTITIGEDNSLYLVDNSGNHKNVGFKNEVLYFQISPILEPIARPKKSLYFITIKTEKKSYSFPVNWDGLQEIKGEFNENKFMEKRLSGFKVLTISLLALVGMIVFSVYYLITHK